MSLLQILLGDIQWGGLGMGNNKRLWGFSAATYKRVSCYLLWTFYSTTAVCGSCRTSVVDAIKLSNILLGSICCRSSMQILKEGVTFDGMRRAPALPTVDLLCSSGGGSSSQALSIGRLSLVSWLRGDSFDFWLARSPESTGSPVLPCPGLYLCELQHHTQSHLISHRSFMVFHAMFHVCSTSTVFFCPVFIQITKKSGGCSFTTN